MKKFLRHILLFTLAAGSVGNVYAEDNVESQIEEIIVEEAISEETTFASETKDDTVVSEKQMVLTVGSKRIKINGVSYTMTQMPVVQNGTTYIPLRFVTDYIINGSINWDKANDEIILSGKTQTLLLKQSSRIARINGHIKVMNEGVKIINNTLMLSAKSLCELFDFKMSYQSSSKTLTLIGKDDEPNHRPEAAFYFRNSSYTEGQYISIANSSWDSDGDALVACEWKVDGDPHVYSEFNELLLGGEAGEFVVSLRVKDGRGAWSDWTERTLVVEPNKAPEIVYFESHGAKYAQGEKITFSYRYDNESWEEIVSEKWTYRHADEDMSKAVIGKPEALFTAGEYIVTLELDDAAGNRSQLVETRVRVTDEKLKSELVYRFTEGSIGAIIDNFEGIDYRESYQDANVFNKTSQSGQLYMSDSPEVVTRDGILYRDTLNGRGRLLFHHINGYDPNRYNGDNRRIVIIAENKEQEPMTVTIRNKSVAGPATDVLRIGQKVLSGYLTGSSNIETYTLQPGERVAIYDSKASRWENGQCLSGLMDIETSGNVLITTASMQHGVALKETMDMNFLAQDVHPRGTFDTTTFNYDLILDDEPSKILIGTGTEDWVNGIDGITGEIVQNRGNFGVSYKLTITATEDTGVILNPRADIFKGAIKWDNDPSQVYHIPVMGNFSGNKTKAAVLGVIKAGETRTLEYMLPNGSSAPVLIGFIPASYWNN